MEDCIRDRSLITEGEVGGNEQLDAKILLPRPLEDNTIILDPPPHMQITKGTFVI